VDRLGYLQDTIDVAKRRARVETAQVIMYRRPREYSETIYSRTAAPPVEVSLLRLGASGPSIAGPSFLYMWMPESISTGLGSIQ
jgi:protease-4